MVSVGPSIFYPQCHPLVDVVSDEVNTYFLENWGFKSEKARKKFVHAGFSRVTCLYFPKALDDRIHFACRLLTVLFLIDDVLEYMSLTEGSMYNEKLIKIARGDILPNRSEPAEFIMYDLWESMRSHDEELADCVLEPMFTFMRAQTDKARLEPMNLEEYFDYREKDVGKALLSSLMRFSMGLHITAEEIQLARPVEMNCSKNISVINDIFSYEKEVLAAAEGHEEGGFLCSSVPIVASESGVDIEESKSILLAMCREWEVHHNALVKEIQLKSQSRALAMYLKGLEYQMSGNELWSRTTKRYSEIKA
ncbi:Aristolochene synthase [Xylaria cf. heliscus]|nr:Aristolochene synthase [Xylaria cf. heliscus]